MYYVFFVLFQLSEVEAGDFKETSYSEWMTNSSLDENVFRAILTSTGFDIKVTQQLIFKHIQLFTF